MERFPGDHFYQKDTDMRHTCLRPCSPAPTRSCPRRPGRLGSPGTAAAWGSACAPAGATSEGFGARWPQQSLDQAADLFLKKRNRNPKEMVSFIAETGDRREHSNQIHKENYYQIPDHVLVNYIHLKKIPRWNKMHEEKLSIPWFSIVIRGVPRNDINHHD